MPTGEKRGKTETQKLEYLQNQKSFLDEIKISLHRGVGGIQKTLYYQDKMLDHFLPKL